MSLSPARASLALALLTILAGCASLPPRPPDDEIRPLLHARGGPALPVPDAADPVPAWLAEPLTLERAVQIALLRSPQLQLTYAELGLERAEVLEAVQVDNPAFSIGRERLSPGDGTVRLAGLSLPLGELIAAPLKVRLAEGEYERARLRLAQAVLDLALDIEAAWYRAAAAEQVAGMREAVSEGAQASAELAGRFHAAGNISQLQLRQEQAFASEARIAAARARAEAVRERLALNTLLGLNGADARWAAAEGLRLPVSAEDDVDALVRLARRDNLQLQAARLRADTRLKAAGITRGLWWLRGAEFEFSREREPDGSRKQGPGLAVELPLFNQGQAERARAQALLDEARARLAMAELAVVEGVRARAQAVAELRDVVALHRDALVPQREDIVARQQERQNFMLIGVFELVQAKLAEYDAYQGYIEALRDYWLARVELSRVVGQRLPSADAPGETAPTLEQILGPQTGGHQGHGMPETAAEAGTEEAGPEQDEDQHKHHHHQGSAAVKAAGEAEDKDQHNHHHHQGDQP
ncbi:TolC family protein [Arenimonas fontis]|uniref:TolC family protein n=1 Tax=Arenimonas fontis TaxID=2608255 RepID=A0A5B2ZFX3_9GAMM|nr:TolC family protein [Arenimonas fontis]KAA2285962.1 TolC family protein [Arenimonas fontis]